MSIALDSPMEALAIHGVLTAVNNVWAWIAFLTAAISFWKIKSSIHHHSPHHLSLQLSPSPPSPPQPKAFPVAAQPEQSEVPSTSCTTSPSVSSKRHISFCTLENRKSGKFSVYYTQDDKKKDDDRIDGEFEEDIDSDRTMSSVTRHLEERERKMSSIKRNSEEEVRMKSSIRCNHGGDGWEMVLKMKTAEMGWYLYQDLTVLDGNVVRLWN